MNDKDVKKYLSQTSWYHATTIESLENILKNGVKHDYNIHRRLDFGYGFYLTPKLNQAKSYIQRSAPYLVDDVSKTQFVIIEFELNLSKLIKQYKLKVFPHYNDTFAEFVFNCRKNRHKKIHHYDMILGVMSDNNPNQLMDDYNEKIKSKKEIIELFKKWTSMEQLSLHNQDICDILVAKDIIYIDDIQKRR